MDQNPNRIDDKPMEVQFAKYRERVADTLTAVAKAMEGGRFFVAIATMEGDGIREPTWYIHDFTDDVQHREWLLDKLRDKFIGESEEPQLRQAQPLPRGSISRPSIKDVMFGKQPD
jgi:hypothetical protein